ncbi:MAG: DUF6036 family nucleotidyltransferase [Verrucomicrobiota bacterium]
MIQINSDFKELLQILADEKVEYLVIGGYAVIYHSQPRSTKDLDIWLKPSVENRKKVMKAFHRFGLPLMGGLTPEDFDTPGIQYAVGTPPCMVDFLTSVPGLNFDEAWTNRVESEEGGYPAIFLGKKDLILSKEIAGRPQDIADIEELNRVK